MSARRKDAIKNLQVEYRRHLEFLRIIFLKNLGVQATKIARSLFF
jgi:hypothetical protein